MSLSRVGSYGLSGTVGTSVTVSMSSLAVGDLVFMTCTSEKSGYEDAISFPSGWTTLGGPYTYTIGGTGYYTIVGYKILVSADISSGITLTTNDSSSTEFFPTWVAYTGIDPHLDVSAITTGGPGATLDVDVTPTNAGEWLVGFCVNVGGAVSGFSNFNGGTVNLTVVTTDSGGYAISIGDSNTTVAQSLMSEVFNNTENALVAAILVAIADTSAPAAPTLSEPANAGYIDVSSGVTLGGFFNSTDGENMNAYALRIKTSSGSYQYYNAGSNTLQSTIVWNTLATQILPGGFWSVTLPNTLVSDAYVYNWSLASQEAGSNLQGSFATDFTFVAQAAPSVTVNDPTGTLDYTTPTVSWTNTLPGGASQIAYEVVIATAIGAGEPGGDTLWTSGVVTSSSTSQVTGSLANGTWYAYVQVTETGGQTSSWAYSAFTISFDDPPSTPTYTVEQGYDGNGVPCLIHTIQSYDNLLDQASSTIAVSSLGNWCCALSSTVNYGGPVNGYDASSNASHILLQSGMSVVTSPGGSNFKQGAATTGTSGYLEGPAGTGAANGAVTGSAFTVEFLFETPSIGAGNDCGIIAGRAGEWNVAYSGSGGYFIYTWYDSGNSAHTANGSATPAADTVYNVCMEWNGTDVYGLVNGVLDATIAVTSAATPTSQSMEMMHNSIAGQIIDEVRVSNNFRYSGGSGVSLIDSSSNASTFTQTGTVTSVSSPAGSAFNQAAEFSSGGYISGPTGTSAADGAITGSAFTAECFYTPTAADNSGSPAMFLGRNTFGTEWVFATYQSGISGTAANVGGTWIGATSLTTGTTYHLALTWNGTTYTFWVNGVSKGTHNDAAPSVGSDPLLLGEVSGYPSTGTVDEVRISNSCRYTTGFTPPTAPFTSDANTEVLLHLDANSGYTPATTEFTSDSNTEMLYHFDGGLQISSAEALDGGYSLEWISATGSNYAVWESYASQIVDISSPYSIQASFYEPGSNPATVTVEWLDDTGTILSTADGTITGSSAEWYPASFNATSDVAAFGVGILITPPSGASSLLIDEIGIEPGTDSSWTLGGYAGTEIVSILRSDGLYVRNAGYTTSVPGSPDYISVASGGNCTPLNFPSQSLVLYDYESVPEEAYTFVLEVQAGGGAYASAVAGPITFSLAGAQWWLIDPITPSLSVEATVTAQTTSGYKLTGANYQLSDATTPQLPSVTTMASFGESGTITVQTQSPTEFGSLKALVSHNDTKWMINPFSQGLYVSIAVADPTGGTSGEAHSSTFKGGTAATPYRESSLTYTQVGRA